MGNEAIENKAKELRREYMKQWRKKNKEKNREYQRTYWERRAQEAQTNTQN